MRIAFMGTPDFAVPCLRKLSQRGHDIALVVTRPDRPAGRGRRPASPPVKRAADALGLRVEQPPSVNRDEFVEVLGAVAPDVIVVVAFGQILSECVLGIPSRGAVNVHASILPAYRGVAPINWAIVNGERETGVTTMFMARKVDAGEIILSRAVPIGENETAGELSDRLAALGADLLAETLALIERGEAPRAAQDPTLASYARKLTKSDGEIDWTRTARQVHNHIRGMTPWPGAYTFFGGKRLQVVTSRPGRSVHAGAPGEFVGVDPERGMEVTTGDGTVWLLVVRPEGRAEMDGASFARGYHPRPGTAPFGSPTEQGEQD